MSDEQELFVIDYSSFLTTGWGEDLHAREVEKDLRRSIDDALVQTG